MLPTISRAIDLSRRTLLVATILTGVVTAQESPTKKAWPDLKQQRWSGTINVPDPVALSVDHQGRVFVTQTQRRKLQDLDIRKNRDWIPDDVGLLSVIDKQKFFRNQLAIGGNDEKQKSHVEDVNKDGHHDWRDLTAISEKIFRLVDSDGDGTADEITTFAEGFQTEVTGIAAGVLAHDGNVWATIAPDVWKLRDKDDDGVADSREVMATGFGLHIAYAGHDMHGLTVGPDGKVYWSIGDKGINVTTKDGRQIAYPNQGGVMRCNPDGSDFEVFAHGLRNVQEFAFDKFGNIFGVDNDADQPGERERFMAIVDGMDAGWRCNYQYRGGQFNPWTDEGLWKKPGIEHPAYIVPPIDHYMDGPAGFKYNPGTALSSEYRDFFFVTNAPKGHYYAFRSERDGDSFKMVDAHEIGSGHALVGLAFGPDGGLYGADWDGGYPLDQKGGVIRIDVPGADQSPIRQETKELLASGFDNRSVGDLTKLMGHPDMRVRMGAQFALVKQKQTHSLTTLLADEDSDLFARLHSVWALGQLARVGDVIAMTALIESLRIDHWAIKAQAAKTLGESGLEDSQPLVDLLTDDDLHVRINAGLAIARRPTPKALPILLKQAAELNANQHYLRHSIVQAIAMCARDDELAKQAASNSEIQRLICVVALRQKRSPLVANFLGDRSNWVATEAARAIHDDDSIAAALSDLAESLNTDVTRNAFYIRRAINANYRIGDKKCASRLLRYATDSDAPEAMRVEACSAIGDWMIPPKLDRVDGRSRQLAVDLRSLDRVMISKGLAALVANSADSIRVAAVTASRKLNLRLSQPALVAVLSSPASPIDLQIEALNSLATYEGETSYTHILDATQSSSTELAVRGIELLVTQYPDRALDALNERLKNSTSTAVQQSCITAIGKLETAPADHFLLQLGKALVDKSIPENQSFEVAAAIHSRAQASTEMKELSAKIDQIQKNRASELLLGDAPKAYAFAFSTVGGDKKKGRQIFRTHLQAQCSRCHRIGKNGSDIGPELTKIAKQRGSKHLLRSIVHPNGDVDPKYFTQALIMDDGKTLRGVVKSRSSQKIVLIDGEGKETVVPSDEVEEVIEQKTSLMPDMTEALTPAEVRNLVAYLSSLE